MSFEEKTFIETYDSNDVDYSSDEMETSSSSSFGSELRDDKKTYVPPFPRRSMYVKGFRPAKSVHIILFEAKHRMPERKKIPIVKKSVAKYDLPKEEEVVAPPMEHTYKVVMVEPPKEVIKPKIKPEVVEEKTNPEEGWTTVKEKRKETKPTSPPIVTPVKKILNRLCRYKSHCKRQDTCPYAHSVSEVKVNDCTYKAKCRYIVSKSPNIYTNKEGCNRPCNLLHPNEAIEAYLKRVMTK